MGALDLLEGVGGFFEALTSLDSLFSSTPKTAASPAAEQHQRLTDSTAHNGFANTISAAPDSVKSLDSYKIQTEPLPASSPLASAGKIEGQFLSIETLIKIGTATCLSDAQRADPKDPAQTIRRWRKRITTQSPVKEQTTSLKIISNNSIPKIYKKLLAIRNTETDPFNKAYNQFKVLIEHARPEDRKQFTVETQTENTVSFNLNGKTLYTAGTPSKYKEIIPCDFTVLMNSSELDTIKSEANHPNQQADINPLAENNNIITVETALSNPTPPSLLKERISKLGQFIFQRIYSEDNDPKKHIFSDLNTMANEAIKIAERNAPEYTPNKVHTETDTPIKLIEFERQCTIDISNISEADDTQKLFLKFTASSLIYSAKNSKALNYILNNDETKRKIITDDLKQALGKTHIDPLEIVVYIENAVLRKSLAIFDGLNNLLQKDNPSESALNGCLNELETVFTRLPKELETYGQYLISASRDLPTTMKMPLTEGENKHSIIRPQSLIQGLGLQFLNLSHELKNPDNPLSHIKDIMQATKGSSNQDEATNNTLTIRDIHSLLREHAAKVHAN